MTYPSPSSEVLLRRPIAPRTMPRHRRLLEILDLARWAPSGDNRQLWCVRRQEEGAELRLRESALGFLDKGPAMRIALGAFGESFELAAAALGVGAEASFEPLGESGGRAVVALGKQRTSSLNAAQLGTLLPRRCSNRRLYRPHSCQVSELVQLALEADHLPNVDVTFVTGKRLEPLSRALALGEKIRLRHADCHREFHAKVRWSAEEAAADPTGFSVDTFEIKRHEQLFLRWTRSWRLFRALDALFRVASLAASYVRRQVLHSGAVVVFSLRDHRVASWIDVGRALQRVWLRATALGLQGQVLGVAPIFLHRLRQGGEGLTSTQRRRVSQLSERLGAIRGMPHPDDLALLLRLGRGPAPTARAGRLPAVTLMDEERCS